MNFLSIDRRVSKHSRMLHWTFANVMGLPMYKSLVYEFLDSFTVKHRERMYDENSAWEFRIQNTNFRWSREEATRSLGFPLFGVPARATLGQRFAMWTRLTGQNHTGPNTSPYAFKCKAWFYIHRLVATNINSKPETVDTVTIKDLNVMHALSKGSPVDWFDIFSERLLRMCDHNGNLSYVGCTSLVTFIAKICELQFCFHPARMSIASLSMHIWKS